MLDLNLFIQSLPTLTMAALVSLQVALCACTIGITLGTILGLVQSLAKQPYRGIITLYVSLVRGTPMLVQIFVVFYALPQLGIEFSPFWAAVVAIGLNSAAYVSQMIRGGVQAVPKGQLEAAKTLGLPFSKQLQHIILPQTFQASWPALGNELVTLIKDSSLASIIGVMELSKQGALIRSQTYDAFTVLLGVALIYLAMTLTMQALWSWLEQKGTTHATG